MQCAFLCPTEILAKQHFETIWKTIKKMELKKDIRIDLLVGSLKQKDKDIIKNKLKNGDIDIIIGTHAIINDDIEFANLKLVIIDEQHKFGVKQREVLMKQGNPHILNMTATPIPRTLALITFGDQDISVIKTKPKGRKEIITKIISNKKRQEAYEWCKSEIRKGNQIFVVCPLVEAKEEQIQENIFDEEGFFDEEKKKKNIEIKSVSDEKEKLEKIFFEHKVDMIYGQMKAEEKKEIMSRFARGESHVLVASTVVEVGIDVPNATVIIIESAERFGIASLHQLRGRVGRNEKQSYCFLFTTKDSPTVRLKAMEKYSSGFDLAEVDMKIRGVGEIFGTRQAGIPDIRFNEYMTTENVKKIREWAKNTLLSNNSKK